MPSPVIRVAHIVPSLEARHGGPSQSVRALANHLADAGDQVDLLTTFAPGDSAMQSAGDRATIRAFPRTAPRFLCPSPALRDHVLGASFDCVHHHSLWLRTLAYAASAARRQGRPLVISPRSMMSDWA